MAITGNKGEWSEVYTFLRLLADGKLFAADEQLNRIKDMFFPIIKIIREEHEYRTDEQTLNINIFYNDVHVLSILSEKLGMEADQLFNFLVNRGAGKGAFAIPASESFVRGIFVTKLKAPSTDKSDINIEIHDGQTGYQSVVGFSIKSDLGAPPTLLNPGKTTNFVFKVDGLYKGFKAHIYVTI